MKVVVIRRSMSKTNVVLLGVANLVAEEKRNSRPGEIPPHMSIARERARPS